jgi:hypothetical protein
VLEVLGLAAVLGLLPAAIASAKGYSFWLWWFYGWMLFIVALPHSLLLRNRKPAMLGTRLGAPAAWLRRGPGGGSTGGDRPPADSTDATPGAGELLPSGVGGALSSGPIDAPLSACPSCGEQIHADTALCPFCGWVRPSA